MNVAQALAQLHSGRVVNDGREPSRYLCLSPELVEVRIRGKQGILNRVFCVGSVAQKAVGPSVERLQGAGQNLSECLTCELLALQFDVPTRINTCILAAHPGVLVRDTRAR